MHLIKVRSMHVNKMIRRHARWQDVPEAQLWCAVLCQAVTDLDIGRNTDYWSAHAFVSSDYFDRVCGALALDAAFYRAAIARLGQVVSLDEAGEFGEFE